MNIYILKKIIIVREADMNQGQLSLLLTGA